MKRICAGLLAHVDAGKTTLSEALLYRGGCLKKLGRVDHKDAFLDTNAMERERGITIFSKQAVLSLPDAQITLLDTPGHVDFSGEMERTLSVLDYAVLVVSGTDGVQSHTETVWKLLRRYGVPVFVFVNKMDLAGADRQSVLEQLARLEEGFVPFDGSLDPDAFAEALAMQSEEAMDAYLENGEVPADLITAMIARRQVFPCLFGSALKLQGVDELLEALQAYTRQPKAAEEFAARVFKISRDEQGNRLTWLKVTGGSLRVKASLTGEEPDGQSWQEKTDQLRVYSGAKFQMVEQAPAGTVCAVTGLTRTWAGQGLGEETMGRAPVLQPVQSCRLLLPEGCDAHAVLPKLTQLQEEDPQLRIVWNERLAEIHLQMMGEVQLDVLKRLIWERFGLDVGFGPGSIVYKETIAGPVEGVGHFEPLRHYAEVHLLLEPLPRGAGLQFDTICSEDVLDRNWQRLILTHLEEKEHLGVLTGSPITDMKITLTAGRAHLKHTEGGDFRQATYRAVRQGLMQADSILLEPWYEFRLEVPAEQVGRAMADVQRMGGSFDPPELLGETSVLTGSVPVAEMRGYAMELAGYTRGKGRLACTLAGYRPCHDSPAVIEAMGYDPERDTENPPDSVFCAHGAGYTVKWDEVPAHAHVESGVRLNEPEPEEQPAPRQTRRQSAPVSSLEEDKQLAAIFERTYGPSKGRELFRPAPMKQAEYHFEPSGPEYLLVDGYNLIFAWEELKKLAADNLAGARQALADLLCNYRGFHDCQVILVFDAYKVPHGTGEVSRYHNIHIVYTKEAETADMYIEKTTYQLAKKRRVRVVTSDGAEQLIILGHGALRISARSFREEVERTNGEIRRILEENRLKNARW
ncbi:translation factor GTPase family protein [Allofournierella massiliensis]|uniref:TetM/TetW/TetO/TetS family tetracycline resistance ribosomal protection protein n=1 Tax=Allofournierella massiliensis TaxID=1650663 RepID=A0ABT7URK1_9FIRM|nr:TetM/TetW/TetO/TetS family tetracycline resistance ribosomal protection protein [Fournierella massiliensis]MDM8201370.1 TetM/TetW/TetO/TetS family tetracycline resistance ribosomal protection protein [Fournierella massiliensis]